MLSLVTASGKMDESERARIALTTKTLQPATGAAGQSPVPSGGRRWRCDHLISILRIHSRASRLSAFQNWFNFPLPRSSTIRDIRWASFPTDLQPGVRQETLSSYRHMTELLQSSNASWWPESIYTLSSLESVACRGWSRCWLQESLTSTTSIPEPSGYDVYARSWVVEKFGIDDFMR